MLNLQTTYVSRVPPTNKMNAVTKPYETRDFLLVFAVGEPGLHLMYCLDGQENVTFVGNTTLVNLGYEEHNLTVYAWDEAGNVGASEPVTFAVTSVTTTLVAVAVILVSVVAVSAGLLFYFKKRKR